MKFDILFVGDDWFNTEKWKSYENRNCLAGSSKIGKSYVINNIFKLFTGLYKVQPSDFHNSSVINNFAV